MYVFVHGDVFVVFLLHGYEYGFLFVFESGFMGLVWCRDGFVDFGDDLGGCGFVKVVFCGDGFAAMVFEVCDLGGMILGGDGFAVVVFGGCAFCWGGM